ncbi:hypothetical protein SORBI_3005G063500, partial [Sorghum bicolor]
ADTTKSALWTNESFLRSIRSGVPADAAMPHARSPADFPRLLPLPRMLVFLPRCFFFYTRARSAFSPCCSPIHPAPIPNPSFGPNPSITMNPLCPPSLSSKQIRAGQGKRASAALDVRFASAAAAPGGLADGSTSSAGEPIAHATATSPTLASLEAAGFPAWCSSSSQLGSSEG